MLHGDDFSFVGREFKFLQIHLNQVFLLAFLPLQFAAECNFAELKLLRRESFIYLTFWNKKNFFFFTAKRKYFKKVRKFKTVKLKDEFEYVLVSVDLEKKNYKTKFYKVIL